VLVDRDIYVPEEWIADLVRRREAGIADDVEFATKPELARRMLEQVRAAGLRRPG
jgi:SRSO17 transposase